MEENQPEHRPKKERYARALLVLNGINQAALAKKIGVTPQHFYQVVYGQRGGTKRPCPKADAIRQAVAKILGKTVQELWSDRTNIKVTPR